MLTVSKTIKQTLLDEDARSHLARLEEENRRARERITELTERNTLLTEEVRWLKAQLFGRSSERSAAQVSPDQRMLFNEAEVLAAIAAADEAQANQVITIGAHERKRKPGRKAIPDDFPRISVLHDIPEEQKVCPHDGTPLVRIGEETAEQYDYVPPQLRVLRHERPKYACPCCHEGVKIAPPPVQLLPKSMASSSMLAHITTAKFVDGLPITRQSKQFRAAGTS